MKTTLLFAVLALALPVCAQVPACSKQNQAFILFKPSAGSYSCTSKTGANWTIAYATPYGGELVVTYDGPAGHFTWEQSVLWSEPVRYQACSGTVCWKFTQHFTYLLGGTDDYLEGPFVVHE